MTIRSNVVTAALTAQNTFSDAIEVPKDSRGHGFVFTMRGTSTPVATFVLQRSTDDGTTWDIIDSKDNTNFEADDTITVNGIENSGAQYRFGIRTGDYTSGTFTGEIRW